MTRKKEIKTQAQLYSPNDIGVQAAFEESARWADRTMIEKTCEWLRNNWRKYINIDADGVVCFGHWENDFRKAMKGE